MQLVDRMGTARPTREIRDHGRHETLYIDPDYERLRADAARRGHDERITRGVIAGGSTLETVGGLVALVVGIAGLTNLPLEMAGVGVIAIGVALLAQGASIMSRWRDAIARFERELGPRARASLRPELRGGMTTEIFTGLLGILLGSLALAGVAPLQVIPAAVIVYGAGLLLGGAKQPDLVFLAPERDPRIARITYDAIQTSGGLMVLVGVGAATLGVLGLADVGPVLTLCLVAILAIGAALLFAGGMLTARLVRPAMFRG